MGFGDVMDQPDDPVDQETGGLHGLRTQRTGLEPGADDAGSVAERLFQAGQRGGTPFRAGARPGRDAVQRCAHGIAVEDVAMMGNAVVHAGSDPYASVSILMARRAVWVSPPAGSHRS